MQMNNQPIIIIKTIAQQVKNAPEFKLEFFNKAFSDIQEN